MQAWKCGARCLPNCRCCIVRSLHMVLQAPVPQAHARADLLAALSAQMQEQRLHEPANKRSSSGCGGASGTLPAASSLDRVCSPMNGASPSSSGSSSSSTFAGSATADSDVSTAGSSGSLSAAATGCNADGQAVVTGADDGCVNGSNGMSRSSSAGTNAGIAGSLTAPSITAGAAAKTAAAAAAVVIDGGMQPHCRSCVPSTQDSRQLSALQQNAAGQLPLDNQQQQQQSEEQAQQPLMWQQQQPDGQGGAAATAEVQQLLPACSSCGLPLPSVPSQVAAVSNGNHPLARKSLVPPPPPTSPGDSAVSQLFGGVLVSTITCTACGHVSVSYEPFLDLSLPIPLPENGANGNLSRKVRLVACGIHCLVLPPALKTAPLWLVGHHITAALQWHACGLYILLLRRHSLLSLEGCIVSGSDRCYVAPSPPPQRLTITVTLGVTPHVTPVLCHMSPPHICHPAGVAAVTLSKPLQRWWWQEARAAPAWRKRRWRTCSSNNR
jgi:hypothetical protein